MEGEVNESIEILAGAFVLYFAFLVLWMALVVLWSVAVWLNLRRIRRAAEGIRYMLELRLAPRQDGE